MAPFVASRPNKEAASRLPPFGHQSVLDWASPDEERDHPGKLDVFGEPLASFHELRTRESNKKAGEWTVEHAIHVARWEFHQADYTSTQLQESKQDSVRNDLLESVLESLRTIPSFYIRRCTAYAQASKKFISHLMKRLASLLSRSPTGHCKPKTFLRAVVFSHNFFGKKWLLAAKFSSPTGDIPERLLKNLKTLGYSDYLNIEASSMIQHYGP